MILFVILLFVSMTKLFNYWQSSALRLVFLLYLSRLYLYYSDIVKQIDILGIDVFKSGGDGFYINRLSDHLRESHHHINRPHKHDSYVVVLFTAGSGIHEIEFDSFEVVPGAIFFLTPGQTHNWQLSADTDGFVLFHSAEFFNARFSGLGIDDFAFYSHRRAPEQIILSAGLKLNIVGNFEKMLHEKSVADRKSQYMILNLLTEIYISIERLIGATAVVEAGNVYHNTFAKFQELLEKHYAEEKSAQRYADWLNISSKHLNRINKTLLNKSTSDLIAARVVLEAKRMLLYTSRSITQIAAELGYSDYAYFSKLFKKHVGLSPSQFVNQYAGFPVM